MELATFAPCENETRHGCFMQRVPRSAGRRGLLVAAGGDDAFASDPAGLIRRQEHGELADVVRSADAAKRRRGHELLLYIAADHAEGLRAFGVHAARRDGVDAD